MQELWQLYDEQGRSTQGKGAPKEEIRKGLLHGAAHVWIYRNKNGKTEVLIQERALTKNTWPGLLDISAAGHINLGEEPIETAVRETKEELGLKISASDLKLVAVTRAQTTTLNGYLENEIKWVYILNLEQDTEFNLQKEEVESLLWKDLAEFKTEIFGPSQKDYVPQGAGYFEALFAALEEE